MRKQNAEHPEHLKDISRMFDIKVGRKLRTDAKGHHQATTHGRQRDTGSLTRLCTLRSYQKHNAWRTHQSVPCVQKGRCGYNGCPNLASQKVRERKRTYDGNMKCEECSAKAGKNIYFCNSVKKGKIVNCHMRFHMKNEH